MWWFIVRNAAMNNFAIINILILGVFANDQWPYSCVEKDTFLDPLPYLEPDYIRPGRTFFVSEIETQYQEATATLAFSDVAFLFKTTGSGLLWQPNPYLTIAVHYVSNDWVPKSRVLRTLSLEEKYAGAIPSHRSLHMLSNVSTDPSNIVTVTQ
jgi:hypothetical protein